MESVIDDTVMVILLRLIEYNVVESSTEYICTRFSEFVRTSLELLIVSAR